MGCTSTRNLPPREDPETYFGESPRSPVSKRDLQFPAYMETPESSEETESSDKEDLGKTQRRKSSTPSSEDSSCPRVPTAELETLHTPPTKQDQYILTLSNFENTYIEIYCHEEVEPVVNEELATKRLPENNASRLDEMSSNIPNGEDDILDVKRAPEHSECPETNIAAELFESPETTNTIEHSESPETNIVAELFESPETTNITEHSECPETKSIADITSIFGERKETIETWEFYVNLYDLPHPNEEEYAEDMDFQDHEERVLVRTKSGRIGHVIPGMMGRAFAQERTLFKGVTREGEAEKPTMRHLSELARIHQNQL